MKICFLVGDIADISGGSNVILEYAAGLQGLGHDVTLVTPQPVVLKEPAWHPRLAELKVLSLSELEGQRFDFAFATWWLTWFDLWRVDASVYGYLNQSLEARFHEERHYKLLNRLTYSLPLLFVTEARWLEELIRKHQPEGRVLYVQNALSRENFPCVSAPPSRGKRLRVLVEGPWGVGFKGVAETFEVLEQARAEFEFDSGWLASRTLGARPTLGGIPVAIHERIPIDRVHKVLQQYDVLIKLSRVEGMYGPPLEMFSQGGTAITYTVTGNDEYMVHGENGLLVEPHNRAQIVRYLRLLNDSPELLAHLRRNALKTAQAFPAWDASTARFVSLLEQVHAEGWNNAHLRPALRAVSAMRGQWLEAVWSGSAADADGLSPTLGKGERTLLQSYRRFKSSLPGRAAKKLVPQPLARSMRRYLTRALS